MLLVIIPLPFRAQRRLDLLDLVGELISQIVALATSGARAPGGRPRDVVTAPTAIWCKHL